MRKSTFFALLFFAFNISLTACWKETTLIEKTNTNADSVKVLALGSFEAAGGHNTKGTATITLQGDTTRLVFENFDTEPGPELWVHLSVGANKNDEKIVVDRLKATNGSFSYTLDKSIQWDKYQYVLVYCKPFDVVIGRAKIK